MGEVKQRRLPWSIRYTESTDSRHVIDANGYHVASWLTEPDARLISAAPDFREGMAGWILIAHLSGAHVEQDLIDWARGVLANCKRSTAETANAAVAKAEGPSRGGPTP